MRYGIGVRMWAPSMPLASDPSTRLSRVVPHEACFCTSTSGMPCLAKKPLSLATNSGPASVSAMKPSFALVVSGPAAAAPCTPATKLVLTAASSAAVPALALRKLRRLSRGLVLIVTIRPFLVGHICRRPLVSLPGRQKSRAPGLGGMPWDSGVAGRPVVGPRGAIAGGLLDSPVTSFVPDSNLAESVDVSACYEILPKIKPVPVCCIMLHQRVQRAVSLCSAKK